MYLISMLYLLSDFYFFIQFFWLRVSFFFIIYFYTIQPLFIWIWIGYYLWWSNSWISTYFFNILKNIGWSIIFWYSCYLNLILYYLHIALSWNFLIRMNGRKVLCSRPKLFFVLWMWNLYNQFIYLSWLIILFLFKYLC